MKRVLCSIALLLMVISNNIYADSIYDRYESIKKGDLVYDIYYTDSLKQNIESFDILYRPNGFDEFYKNKDYQDWKKIPRINDIEFNTLVTKVENLAINCFGKDKIFNQEGSSNIKEVVFSLHISTERVYLRYICFDKEIYNLITDEEVETFIERFNKEIRMKVSNKEEFNENAIIFHTYINPFVSSSSYERYSRGDLHYGIFYVDSLKQEIRSFYVSYLPKMYQEILKAGKRVERISINKFDHYNLEAGIEYLVVSCFGEDKIFNKDGDSNIEEIEYAIHIVTGKVYFGTLTFKKDAYNLITDEEILSFAEKFNSNVRVKVQDIEKFDEKSVLYCSFKLFDKKRGYYPIVEKK